MVQVTEFSLSAGTGKNPSVSFTDAWKELEVPQFQLPKHSYGSTGYLDGLKPEDMTVPVMKGIDKWDRPFVAVHVRVTLLKTKDNGDTLVPVMNRKSWRRIFPSYRKGLKRLTEENVEVYFQRYSNKEDIWTSGGKLNLMTSNMCQSDKDFLGDLLEKRRAIRETQLWREKEYILVELV